MNEINKKNGVDQMKFHLCFQSVLILNLILETTPALYHSRCDTFAMLDQEIAGRYVIKY